jgi:hypothetical protein
MVARNAPIKSQKQITSGTANTVPTIRMQLADIDELALLSQRQALHSAAAFGRDSTWQRSLPLSRRLEAVTKKRPQRGTGGDDSDGALIAR